MRLKSLLMVIAVGTSGCTAQEPVAPPTTAKLIAEFICAEPRNRVEKVNQQQCEAYYASVYGDGVACRGLSVAGCMFTIRQMELALLVPKFKPAQP